MINPPTIDSSPTEERHGPRSRRGIVPVVIGAAVVSVLSFGAAMMWRADAKTNKVALVSSPKLVTVFVAKGASYRPSRTYVGTLEPWVQASVGPQLVSAYIDTVLVRPGATVRRGDVLATLDCRNASAAQLAIASQARAIDAHQKALASQSARTQGLLDGGFVSPNQAEQERAASASELAQLEATKAKVSGSALEVNDCILRAPFDGEVARRTMDPGAFVHPGAAIVSVVDRSTIRMTADAPENDFDVVVPGTKVTIHLYATNKNVSAIITRRSPSADPMTRTVHFEIDVPDPTREIPVGTTGEVRIEVGEAAFATAVPLYAATLRGVKATVFVVDGDLAHLKTIAVKGEIGGTVYLDTSLPAGARVVTEGRALLMDGDRVTAKEAESEATPAASASTASADEKQP